MRVVTVTREGDVLDIYLGGKLALPSLSAAEADALVGVVRNLVSHPPRAIPEGELEYTHLGPLNDRERLMLDALRKAQQVFKCALPKFNWGASHLDGEAISLLNTVPGIVGGTIGAIELYENVEGISDLTAGKVQLTGQQVKAIQCAHADLAGVYQFAIRDGNGGADSGHDWEAHKLSIQELEDSFPDICEHIPLGDE